MLDKCKSKFNCREEGCGKRHPTPLHRPKMVSNVKTGSESNVHTQFSDKSKFSLLQILPVILKGETTEFKTNALLDPGSDFSLISLI